MSVYAVQVIQHHLAEKQREGLIFDSTLISTARTLRAPSSQQQELCKHLHLDDLLNLVKLVSGEELLHHQALVARAVSLAEQEFC